MHLGREIQRNRARVSKDARVVGRSSAQNLDCERNHPRVFVPSHTLALTSSPTCSRFSGRTTGTRVTAGRTGAAPLTRRDPRRTASSRDPSRVPCDGTPPGTRARSRRPRRRRRFAPGRDRCRRHQGVRAQWIAHAHERAPEPATHLNPGSEPGSDPRSETARASPRKRRRGAVVSRRTASSRAPLRRPGARTSATCRATTDRPPPASASTS